MSYPPRLMTGAEFVCWCKDHIADDLVRLDAVERYSEVIRKPILAHMIVPCDDEGIWLEKLHYALIHTPKDGFEARKQRTAKRKMDEAKKRVWVKGFNVMNKTMVMGGWHRELMGTSQSYGYIYDNKYCSLIAKTLEQLAMLDTTQPIECTEYFWKKIIFDV